VVPHGRAIAQRIKATPGITGLSPPRVHIDGEVWHLDVVFSLYFKVIAQFQRIHKSENVGGEYRFPSMGF